jgi:predicted choloylglycine hydrolase
MTRQLCFGGLFVAGLVAVPALSSMEGPVASADLTKSAIQQDEVVAGSPNDFLEVRHVVLKGTNLEIGRALAILAKDRYQCKPVLSTDRLRTRAQRRYFEENYPILYDRIRGVASAFDQNVDDDGFNFSGLGYPMNLSLGCSVVHYPPKITATGAGVVSRNYDFTTGTLWGNRPQKGEVASTARPYVVEMYPDRGYASLGICSYDLLSGVLDGVNSEGLTVALLGDDETVEKYSREPAGLDAAGLAELQMPRMLLDTCATVEEAKEALLKSKKTYSFMPVHYLVADRHGQAFVWEYSQTRNRDYFIDNPNKPLITTNFSLHRYLEENGPPSAEKVKDVCSRYCKLAEHISNQPGRLTLDFIKDSHKAVDIVAAPVPTRAPNRTLWHALYFPDERKLQVSFYLRDEPNPTDKAKTWIVRTDYLEFTLGKTKPSE